MYPPAERTLDILERLAELIHDVLAAAAEITNCWPVREHHRRSTLPTASTYTDEIAHAL